MSKVRMKFPYSIKGCSHCDNREECPTELKRSDNNLLDKPRRLEFRNRVIETYCQDYVRERSREEDSVTREIVDEMADLGRPISHSLVRSMIRNEMEKANRTLTMKQSGDIVAHKLGLEGNR